MQRNIRPALKAVGMSAFAVFLSFFVYISLFVLVRHFSTEVIGYTLYEINEQGGSTVVETLSEPPKTLKENQNYAQQRSEMSGGASALLGVLQTVCGLGVVFCFVGSVFAKEAARDRNDVDFNRATADKARGFKIGALAAIPLFVMAVTAVILKVVGSGASAFYWVYRWFVLNPVKPIVDLITSNAADLNAAPLWAIIVLILLPVLFFAFCGGMYLICYNEDSIIAKLLYKSTKKKNKGR